LEFLAQKKGRNINLDFEIVIGKSIGKIKLGMTRQEVHSIYNDFIEYKEIPYGYDYEMIYDCNDDFQIFYDQNEAVEFILCMSPEKIVMNGQRFNKEIMYQDLLNIAKQDDDVDEDDEGFTCDSLGFGVCLTEDDDGRALIESVQIVKKDFWKNEPK
jgi:hypothetical protein